jgi:hypothetical protein
VDPETRGDVRTGWRLRARLWAIGLAVAILGVFAALMKISRGRGRVLEVGLRAAALVMALAFVGVVVLGVVKRRGRGLTLREAAVAVLGVVCLLLTLWFVMMFG